MPTKAIESARTKRNNKASGITKLAARKKYHRLLVKTQRAINFTDELKRALPSRHLETNEITDCLHQCLMDFAFRYAKATA